MSWRVEKTDEGRDLVFDGIEQGIAVSPLKGIANVQNANISTDLGEVMASYARTSETPASLSGQTLTPDGATLFDAPATLNAGMWIQVTASTVSSITAATSPAPTTASIDYLVVGGGGGGGAARQGGAGGGGAGGMETGTTNVTATTYVVTVGEGGAGGTSFKGTDGGASSLGSLISVSGGGGGGAGIVGSSPSTVYDGNAGGSGGGGGGATAGSSGAAGNGVSGEGSNGGTGRASATIAGGGGGGKSATGGNAASGVGGNGGDGTASSITGSSVTYAAGGGGGSVGTAGTGGSSSAGGNGGDESDGGDANPDNPGSGGGGASDSGNVLKLGGDGANGIVVVSYTTGSIIATGGNITFSGGNTIHTFTQNGQFIVLAIPAGGYYFVSYKNSSNKIKLSAKFDPLSANPLTHGTTGSITFNTVNVPNSALAKATERYTTATGVEYRYYILDTNGYAWVYDTYVYDTTLAASGVGTKWMMSDYVNYNALAFKGMAVINGMLLCINNSRIWGKPTMNLGTTFRILDKSYLNDTFPTHKNFAIAAQQGKMYYADGNYVGELFPTTSLVTGVANVQSNCKYTASSSTGTISYIINGSLPYDPGGVRIPVVFYTDVYGTLPTAISADTVYFLEIDRLTETFGVSSTVGGDATLDIATGASGNQYFTTFFPFGDDAGIEGTNALVQFSSQRLNLPQNEVVQSMVEVGNVVLIGCSSNIVYPWNQVDAIPSDFIALPEGDVKTMINVNNMAYIFAGNKGNIYITNTSTASLVLKVPDYCAGVPGTPLTYIEPYFTWGDAEYVRGRVYFSILDQTATKAGNCGGIWSFVPTQNFYYGQDIGLALRLENRNSYGDYDGYATIILGNQEQQAVSPQYWSAWQDSYSTGTSTFGIDNTGTTPVTQYIIETDLVPTGTLLSKDTFTQLEYKLSTPLASGDSVQLYYRLNGTNAWTTCGTTRTESDDPISGYYDQAFQKTQWLQLRAIVTTGGTTASSFVKLVQLRLR